MSTRTTKGTGPKWIALVLVSALAAWFFRNRDIAILSKLQTLSRAQIIQQQKEILSHPYWFHFIFTFILGGIFLGAVEFIAAFIRIMIEHVDERQKEHEA